MILFIELPATDFINTKHDDLNPIFQK